MNLSADIELAGVITNPTIIDKLFGTRKTNLDIITYTISELAAESVLAAAKRGRVRIIYGQRTAPKWLDEQTNIECRCVHGIHTKLYLGHKEAYAGSTNLALDTIGNLMIKLTPSQLVRARTYFNLVWETRKAPKSILL